MNTEELIGQFISAALSGVCVYTHYHFKKYYASKGQCQKVHRMIENAQVDTKILFSQSATTLALKSDLKVILQQLNEEARKLNDMTIRIPLKRLQRE